MSFPNPLKYKFDEYPQQNDPANRWCWEFLRRIKKYQVIYQKKAFSKDFIFFGYTEASKTPIKIGVFKENTSPDKIFKQKTPYQLNEIYSFYKFKKIKLGDQIKHDWHISYPGPFSELNPEKSYRELSDKQLSFFTDSEIFYTTGTEYIKNLETFTYLSKSERELNLKKSKESISSNQIIFTCNPEENIEYQLNNIQKILKKHRKAPQIVDSRRKLFPIWTEAIQILDLGENPGTKDLMSVLYPKDKKGIIKDTTRIKQQARERLNSKNFKWFYEKPWRILEILRD